jgi:hypothetical protein
MPRRANREGQAEAGGWSCFVTSWAGMDWLNPAGHIALRGNGEAAYAGWSTSPGWRNSALPGSRAPDLAAQKAICVDMQKQAMIDVPYYPLGQYIQPTAYRSITGIGGGLPDLLERPASLRGPSRAPFAGSPADGAGRRAASQRLRRAARMRRRGPRHGMTPPAAAFAGSGVSATAAGCHEAHAG